MLHLCCCCCCPLQSELKVLEELHRIYDLYIWLSYRLDTFRDQKAALRERGRCSAAIESGLDHLATFHVNRWKR